MATEVLVQGHVHNQPNGVWNQKHAWASQSGLCSDVSSLVTRPLCQSASPPEERRPVWSFSESMIRSLLECKLTYKHINCIAYRYGKHLKGRMSSVFCGTAGWWRRGGMPGRLGEWGGGKGHLRQSPQHVVNKHYRGHDVSMSCDFLA